MPFGNGSVIRTPPCGPSGRGLLLREARWAEIWSYVRLGELLVNWQHIDRHLGRKRAFWNWLIDGCAEGRVAR